MAGELGYDTGPFVTLATFCDQVITGNDGVLSVIRVIDQVTLSAQGDGAPNELPEGVVSTTLVVSLRAGDARGAQRIRIVLSKPSGQRENGPEALVNFAAGEHGGANIIMTPFAFKVDSPGLYWADIFVNDRLVSRVPLMIQYAFTR